MLRLDRCHLQLASAFNRCECYRLIQFAQLCYAFLSTKEDSIRLLFVFGITNFRPASSQTSLTEWKRLSWNHFQSSWFCHPTHSNFMLCDSCGNISPKIVSENNHSPPPPPPPPPPLPLTKISFCLSVFLPFCLSLRLFFAIKKEDDTLIYNIGSSRETAPSTLTL